MKALAKLVLSVTIIILNTFDKMDILVKESCIATYQNTFE